jgi:hypothetical protein
VRELIEGKLRPGDEAEAIGAYSQYRIAPTKRCFKSSGAPATPVVSLPVPAVVGTAISG